MKRITYEEAVELDKQNKYWDIQSCAEQHSKLAMEELAHFDSLPNSHPYRVAHRILSETDAKTVLDVGCGAGVYSTLIGDSKYLGVDVSQCMIDLARKNFPDENFICVSDLDSLEMHHDVVIEGCVILHTRQWMNVLYTCCALARKFVLLHRTPYAEGATIEYWLADAYGQKALQIHYNWPAIVIYMGMLGFQLRVSESIQGGRILSTLWQRTR